MIIKEPYIDLFQTSDVKKVIDTSIDELSSDGKYNYLPIPYYSVDSPKENDKVWIGDDLSIRWKTDDDLLLTFISDTKIQLTGSKNERVLITGAVKTSDKEYVWKVPLKGVNTGSQYKVVLNSTFRDIDIIETSSLFKIDKRRFMFLHFSTNNVVANHNNTSSLTWTGIGIGDKINVDAIITGQTTKDGVNVSTQSIIQVEKDYVYENTEYGWIVNNIPQFEYKYPNKHQFEDVNVYLTPTAKLRFTDSEKHYVVSETSNINLNMPYIYNTKYSDSNGRIRTINRGEYIDFYNIDTHTIANIPPTSINFFRGTGDERLEFGRVINILPVSISNNILLLNSIQIDPDYKNLDVGIYDTNFIFKHIYIDDLLEIGHEIYIRQKQKYGKEIMLIDFYNFSHPDRRILRNNIFKFQTKIDFEYPLSRLNPIYYYREYTSDTKIYVTGSVYTSEIVNLREIYNIPAVDMNYPYRYIYGIEVEDYNKIKHTEEIRLKRTKTKININVNVNNKIPNVNLTDRFKVEYYKNEDSIDDMDGNIVFGLTTGGKYNYTATCQRDYVRFWWNDLEDMTNIGEVDGIISLIDENNKVYQYRFTNMGSAIVPGQNFYYKDFFGTDTGNGRYVDIDCSDFKKIEYIIVFY